MFEIPGLQTASNDLRGQPITSDLKFVFRGLNNLCCSASPAPIVLYLTNLAGRSRLSSLELRTRTSSQLKIPKILRMSFMVGSRAEDSMAVSRSENSLQNLQLISKLAGLAETPSVVSLCILSAYLFLRLGLVVPVAVLLLDQGVELLGRRRHQCRRGGHGGGRRIRHS